MPTFTASSSQIATYLLGVCPFSIAFLVFLNSSVSFIITDLIGQENEVGNAVGNLGFADELVALVACPLWGLLSDRIGVRTVCVCGYAIICVALLLFVQAHNVYPQLLLGRLFFSIGGAAASTMVTAVLPTMSFTIPKAEDHVEHETRWTNGHAPSPSITSELTITPERFHSHDTPANRGTAGSDRAASVSSTSRIAGLVGACTGLGALLALFVFLPLPATFQKRGASPQHALQYSFYVVAAVALVLCFACGLGLRNLKSEEGKGLKGLFRDTTDAKLTASRSANIHGLGRSLLQAANVGIKDADIAIGYVGGFVARASSVGISLFIPLLVNAMFTSSGLCQTHGADGTPSGLPDIKRQCPRAYIVAAELTGVSQMTALLAAPVFGYWSAQTKQKGLPLAVASVAGIVGYPLFATQFNPDDNDKSARAVAFIAVCLIGFSQIGAIVCSLASIGSGVLSSHILHPEGRLQPGESSQGIGNGAEHEPLLSTSQPTERLSDLKGSIAGVYSFYGGAAILILTKAGGALFDHSTQGAPFYIMSAFNAVLLLATGVAAILQRHRSDSS